MADNEWTDLLKIVSQGIAEELLVKYLHEEGVWMVSDYPTIKLSRPVSKPEYILQTEKLSSDYSVTRMVPKE